MRSVISRPVSLRSTFTSWMRSSSLALEEQLVVERRVERDRHAVLARDRPALAADTLDEHLVRARARARRPRSARPSSSSNSPALQLLAHVAQRRAELGPEHRQVRLHAQLGRLDLAEVDLLDAQLLGDLVGVALGARGARRRRAGAAAGAASAATPSAPGGRARRRAAPRRSRRAAGRPARPAPASGARSTDAGPSVHEVAPEMVGEERHHRRDHAQRLDERVPERAERGLVERCRSGAASGGCTSSRRRRRTRRTRGSRRRSASPRSASVASATSCVRALDEPAVERPQLDVRARGRLPATARSPRCSP